MPKHQAMIQKKAPMATDANCCHDTNVMKKMPGINTIKEYFMPLTKHRIYSIMVIFNNDFK
jgi:hypothetical protein